MAPPSGLEIWRGVRRPLVEAGPEILADTDLPENHWRQIWSNHPGAPRGAI